MIPILEKTQVTPFSTRMVLEAPDIARSARPGQFVILRVDEKGERFPLTLADFDAQNGTITIVFQVVGVSTQKLDRLSVGESIPDIAGPLGHPLERMDVQNVICVGGGVGTAALYPKAKAFHAWGAHVVSIIGARSGEHLVLREEMKEVSDRFLIATDDGSEGHHGFVTQVLADELGKEKPDLVVAVGPLIMMKACSEVTRPMSVKTLVSLNPVMVDGTGMCGGCRVKVGDGNKFACVDGPTFDGHEVDFDELLARQNRFQAMEKEACRLHEQRGEGR